MNRTGAGAVVDCMVSVVDCDVSIVLVLVPLRTIDVRVVFG